MIPADNADVGVGRDLLTRFVALLVTDQNMPCHHQRLCAGFAFGKTALDEQLIQAYFWDGHVVKGPSALPNDWP